MSAFDGVLIFGGVGLIIILPIVALAGIYYLGRRNKHKFQSVIEMDGASCVQAKDGSVAIAPRTWLNFSALIFFVVILGMCGLLLANSVSQNLTMSALEQAAVLAFSTLPIILAIIYLWRALRRPAFYFSPERQTLDIRQGWSVRQIPFAQMAKLAVEGWQVDNSQIETPCAGIKLDLTNGEAIELGTLSSLKGGEDLQKRCERICRLVADVTGASLPPELHAGNA